MTLVGFAHGALLVLHIVHLVHTCVINVLDAHCDVAFVDMLHDVGDVEHVADLALRERLIPLVWVVDPPVFPALVDKVPRPDHGDPFRQ